MDHDVTLFQFFIQTKKSSPWLRFNHAEFGKSAKFYENPLQTYGNMGPQTCQFLQEMYARRQTLATCDAFLFKNSNFGVSYLLP